MDIQQIIKDRYKELPEDIQQAIKNTNLAEKFMVIANKHSLRIDQNGSLQTETLLVMLGLEPSEDYVDNVQKALEVSRNEAQSIAEDVNKEILGSIRSTIQSIEEKQEKQESNSIQQTPKSPPPPPIPANPIPTPPPPTNPIPLTSLEKAGNFSIEREAPSSSPLYNDSNLKRESVLNDLENIEKLKNESSNAFVEHLLSNPVPNPKPTEVKNVATTPQNYSADPYREQP